ncbi:hypothetical protein ACHHYP_10031 [Achlya hypogyna]|uniref:Mediator complex subunit Med12 LCEWAV-domain domain-containing protein n=1 Tax=Achlya hypogyna TaxID=1202772 RepID=A0A1V9ZIK6_ACHHY|nr:hypothetical protein ACHHYP_10031 [Achlya hypogyna]
MPGPPPMANGRTDGEYRSHSASRAPPSHGVQRRPSATRPAFLSTQSQRLQKRQELLEMNSFQGPIEDTTTLRHALSVFGLDPRYLKDPENPNSTPAVGIPGVSPTHPSNPEEQYHHFAKRRSAYVAQIARGLGAMPGNWHKQYAFFSDRTPLFDRLPDVAALSLTRPAPSPTSGFVEFVYKQVRRFAEPGAHHQWMLDLARGKFTLADMIQTYGGIAHESWLPTDDSKCPILDSVAKYRVGLLEATWYIQANVVYQELHALRRDTDHRAGDWFYHSKRFQRRAHEWTGLLLQSLVASARQSFDELPVPPVTPPAPAKVAKGKKSAVKAPPPLPPVPAISHLDKCVYLLRLSAYQFQLHLLDRNRYLQGLLALYQKCLEPRAGGAPELPLPLPLVVQLLRTLHGLLPDMLEHPMCVKLLVKIVLQHLQLLVADGAVASLAVEALVCGMCHLLRDVLLYATDHLVHLRDDVLQAWPAYVLSDRFFDRTQYSDAAIARCVAQCQAKLAEVSARIARLKEFHAVIARKRPKDAPCDKKQRHDVEIFELLDEFHGGKTKLEVDEVYAQIFQDDPVSIDVHAVHAVCEWAVSIYRPQEYKFLSVVFLLETHNHALCQRDLGPRQHASYLQEPLTAFLHAFVPAHGVELASLFDLFSLLVRRRLFFTDAFIAAMALYLEPAGAPSPLLSPSFHFEFGPHRGGFKDIANLTEADRLRLYLWQFPRGPAPFGSVALRGAAEDEAVVSMWMALVGVTPEELQRSRALERVLGLCWHVFSTLPTSELDVMAKVYELYMLIKKLSAHDKTRVTAWLLQHVYADDGFFVLSELVNVEFTLRLVLLLLELTDVLAMLQVVIHFLRHAPVYMVKTVLMPLLERHQMTFYASQDLLALIQAYEYRCRQFRKANFDPDDKVQTIAMFVARIYQSNSKALDKALKALELPSPPEVLMKAFFAILKEDKLKSDPTKDLSLEGVNPKCAFPKDKDTMGPDLAAVLAKVLAALAPTDEPSAPLDRSFPHLMGTVDASEAACKDAAVEDGVNALLAYNPTTSQQRIFIFRAVLTDVMDKWLALLASVAAKKPAATSGGMRQVNLTYPAHVHRCVRLLRDFIDAQEETDRKLIRDTLLAWLHREVIVGFNGQEVKADAKAKAKHPFLTRGDAGGREAYQLNLKGRLDKTQYGLKLFLVSLVLHGVVDLTQVLRFVLVPGFPKKNAKTTEARSLPNQLLSMALAFHLIGEAPPLYVQLDAKTMALIEDPVSKYHWRFLRSMVPSAVLFPLLFLFCQMSYQLSVENNALKPRDERGQLASLILFHCTNDVIVREVLFADKELRERHIVKDPDNIWLLNVILKLLSRPLNAPAELSPNRIQLLKAEAIFEAMDKWLVHRGGALYLEVQILRQHQKLVKRAKKPPLPRLADARAATDYDAALSLAPVPLDDATLAAAALSASDKIGILVTHRLFRRCARPAFLAPDVPAPAARLERALAQREAADLALAHLLAASITCVPSPPIAAALCGAVVSRVCEQLELDCAATTVAEYTTTFSGPTVATFLRRVLTAPLTPSSVYARYLRSLVRQLELLLAACQADPAARPERAALRRKLALRLQLVSIAASVTNYTLPYRNGIVKLLVALLGTPVVAAGAGLTLFAWILDLVPLVPSTVFADIDPSDLIAGLGLPPELARRVYVLLPKAAVGARPLALAGKRKMDPWARLEGFPDLPSDGLAPAPHLAKAKRRRVWRAL